MVANSEYRTLLIIIFIEINTRPWLCISKLHIDGAIFCCCIYLLCQLFVNTHIFQYWSHTFRDFVFFKILINLLATTDSWLCVEYISISLSCNHNFIEIISLIISLPLTTYILSGLQPDSSKNFWKALVIVTPFLVQKNNPCIFNVNINNT